MGLLEDSSEKKSELESLQQDFAGIRRKLISNEDQLQRAQEDALTHKEAIKIAKEAEAAAVLDKESAVILADSLRLRAQTAEARG